MIAIKEALIATVEMCIGYQALARSLEEGLKRLHSSVVKRGSPELNWESWEVSTQIFSVFSLW